MRCLLLARAELSTPETNFDWKRHRLPPKDLVGVNPLTVLLLEAVDQALRALSEGAISDGIQPDLNRIGIVVGTCFQSSFLAQWQLAARLPLVEETFAESVRGTPLANPQVRGEYRQTLESRLPALVDETCSYTGSTMASKILRTFDVRGEAICLDAGVDSASAALRTAADLLAAGECEMVICACGHPALNLIDIPKSWYARAGWPVPAVAVTSERQFRETELAAAALALRRHPGPVPAKLWHGMVLNRAPQTAH